MKTFAEFMAEAAEANEGGTYASVGFDPESTEKLSKYIADNGIPNPVPPEKFHSTLLSSRKPCPGYTGDPHASYDAKVSGLEVWPNRDGNRALVAKLDCPGMSARHEELMAKHGATLDYPEYKPHTTLSYDIGDFDHTKLPPFTDDLKTTGEKAEDLDLKWKDK